MAVKTLQQAQNPLILRCHRLIEAFAKSDDERDFYIDRQEGFIIYVDLDKQGSDLDTLQNELNKSSERYALIPKLTFYETKKIMEGFVNEKVYDIDTKEKMMEIIGSKEAMANFLDFLNDHHSEFEKWQVYYQERSRVRIIEWLRQNHFTFVFEEDLDLPRDLIEKLKKHLFEIKVDKEILAVRKELFNKSKTYYSNEALNPRPKRGRPPKQTTKTEIEPQVTSDMYTTVPSQARPFLFAPGLGGSPANAFSSRFENVQHGASKPFNTDFNVQTEDLKEKLSLLRRLSNRWMESEKQQSPPALPSKASPLKEDNWDDEEDSFEEDEEEEVFTPAKKSSKQIAPLPQRKAPPPKPIAKKVTPAKPAAKNVTNTKAIAKKSAPPKLPVKAVSPKKPQPLSKKAPSKPLKKVAPMKKVVPPPKKENIKKINPAPAKKVVKPVVKNTKQGPLPKRKR